MNYEELEAYFNRHCKIKLRSGKEVFGVLWADASEAERPIYFASNIEHQAMLRRRKKLQEKPTNPLKLGSDDILSVSHIEDES